MINAEQREIRKKYVGASEVASILNLDHFRNAYDLWLLKTGKIADAEETAAMRRGNYMELSLLAFAKDELGELIVDPEHLEFIKGELIDHPDAIVKVTGNPVEAKSQGERSEELWGEAGGDIVPDRVIMQAQAHLYCAGKDICHVPAALPYRDFEMFQVKRDETIIQAICDAVGEFMALVKSDTPPSAVPNLELIKRVSRQPNSIIRLDDGKVAEFQKIKEAFKALEARKEQLQSELLASLWDEFTNCYAEAGEFGDGQMLTYYPQSKRSIDVERLKTEQPEIYEAYLRETSYRVMRFSKAKKKLAGK